MTLWKVPAFIQNEGRAGVAGLVVNPVVPPERVSPVQGAKECDNHIYCV